VFRRLALLPLVLVAACSSGGGAQPPNSSFSQPQASAFSSGPCSAVAPAVLDVGKDAHSLAGRKPPTPAISASLKTNQDLINAVQPGLSADLAPAFRALVIQIGVVRLRTDTNTYQPSLGSDLMSSYDALVKACTAGAPAGTSATPTP
jgi:hypothetical protein